MEKIDFKKQNIPFTQIANGVINDVNLSIGAKGLYTYLYSKPDGWCFSEIRIAQGSKNSRKSIRTAIKELLDCGYLLRFKLPNGRMIYKVIFPPFEPEYQNDTLGFEPEYQKATVPNSHSAESVPISNKDKYQVIKNTKNTNAGEQSSQDREFITSTVGEENSHLIPEIIKLFEVVNPACKSYYGNVTQRKACLFLLKEYGFEQVSKVIAILPETNTMPYIPSINTPLQLQQKWSTLEFALKRKQSEDKIKKPKIAFC